MQILIPIPFPRINILGNGLIPPVLILYTLLPPAPRSRTFRFWGPDPDTGGAKSVMDGQMGGVLADQNSTGGVRSSTWVLSIGAPNIDPKRLTQLVLLI